MTTWRLNPWALCTRVNGRRSTGVALGYCCNLFVFLCKWAVEMCNVKSVLLFCAGHQHPPRCLMCLIWFLPQERDSDHLIKWESCLPCIKTSISDDDELKGV
jgi:hypothetical protein